MTQIGHNWVFMCVAIHSILQLNGKILCFGHFTVCYYFFVSAFNLFLLSFLRLYYTIGITFAPFIVQNSSSFREFFFKTNRYVCYSAGGEQWEADYKRRIVKWEYEVHNEIVNIRIAWYLLMALQRISLSFVCLGTMSLIALFFTSNWQVMLIRWQWLCESVCLKFSKIHCLLLILLSCVVAIFRGRVSLAPSHGQTVRPARGFQSSLLLTDHSLVILVSVGGTDRKPAARILDLD